MCAHHRKHNFYFDMLLNTVFWKHVFPLLNQILFVFRKRNEFEKLPCDRNLVGGSCQALAALHNDCRPDPADRPLRPWKRAQNFHAIQRHVRQCCIAWFSDKPGTRANNFVLPLVIPWKHSGRVLQGIFSIRANTIKSQTPGLWTAPSSKLNFAETCGQMRKWPLSCDDHIAFPKKLFQMPPLQWNVVEHISVQEIIVDTSRWSDVRYVERAGMQSIWAKFHNEYEVPSSGWKIAMQIPSSLFFTRLPNFLKQRVSSWPHQCSTRAAQNIEGHHRPSNAAHLLHYRPVLVGICPHKCIRCNYWTSTGFVRNGINQTSYSTN